MYTCTDMGGQKNSMVITVGERRVCTKLVSEYENILNGSLSKKKSEPHHPFQKHVAPHKMPGDETSCIEAHVLSFLKNLLVLHICVCS